VAFEAFRAQAEARRSGRRKSLWYALSIGFHGALLAAGIAYSFWHIEELSPPLLKVTFLSAAPPPPPAAGPAGGGGAAAKKRPVIKPKPIVQPPQEIVQPRETPKKEQPQEEPKPTPKSDDSPKGSGKGVIGGTPDGTPGGSANGRIGGALGGTGSGAPTGAPKFLPASVGMAQKIAGGDPPFPPSLRRPGAVYHVLVKFCVTANGAVDKVTIVKSAESQLDGGIVDTLTKSWRFRPYMPNAMPVPFCTIYDFQFKTQ
jgi:outer membrane biosynthesis protein TonB